MDRIRNKLVMKISMKGCYQKIPNDDIGCEAKPEEVQENNNKDHHQTQNEPKLTQPSSTIKLLSLIRLTRTDRSDKKGKYSQLQSNCKNSKEDVGEIYNNSFTD